MSTTTRSASAGPSADTKIRSDLVVRYEPGNGPLAVTVTSKVDYLFGEAIGSAARRVAEALGAATGTLVVEDY
ncbi:MAG: citrate lyase acyl carrier protein, partial [Acidobacteria bacterium]|nr:citrate lyase acyl carrier protein [Acidobacteriota bacterium]